MQVSAWLLQATTKLVHSGSDSARLDAELLLAFALGKNRTWLFTWPDAELSLEAAQQAEALLARRLLGEPIAHILGEREFWSLRLKTNPSTLIPRPDTETLVEWALALDLPLHANVLDLGTGTGAIALALASEQPTWRLSGVDFSPEAVALAQDNSKLNNISSVTFYQSNWFGQVQGRFDLILSNPPYIDAQDPHLNQGDVRFEPRTALVAADQGLADLARIIDESTRFLQPTGWLLLEHGHTQAPAVRRLLEAKGFTQVQSRTDLGGHERCSGGQWAMA